MSNSGMEHHGLNLKTPRHGQFRKHVCTVSSCLQVAMGYIPTHLVAENVDINTAKGHQGHPQQDVHLFADVGLPEYRYRTSTCRSTVRDESCLFQNITYIVTPLTYARHVEYQYRRLRTTIVPDSFSFPLIASNRSCWPICWPTHNKISASRQHIVEIEGFGTRMCSWSGGQIGT